MKLYKFYATLLDSFQNYIESSKLWNMYWGGSENPSISEEDFEREQFQGLIDRINRVPFESEAADKGTCYNELIDCLILNKKPEKEMEFKTYKDLGVIAAAYKSYIWEFPLDLTLKIRDYFKDSIPQVHVSAPLETKYGTVELYGYIDELLPFKVCDLKTTGKYNAFKFRDHWQHMVYPYCLIESGNLINDFEYVVTDFKQIYIEQYSFVTERDVPLLVEHCERFIEFLESNRELITDKKIFGEI
jgi:hypothetical protein